MGGGSGGMGGRMGGGMGGGMGGRMGGDTGGDTSDGSGEPTFRGQSPDPSSGDRVCDITFDCSECGRYVGPMDPPAGEKSQPQGQATEVKGQGASAGAQPTNVCGGPSDFRGEVRGQEVRGQEVVAAAGQPNDSLFRQLQKLNQALAQNKISRSRLILTQQYSPNAGQVNPALQPSTQWTNSGTATTTAYGQANGGTSSTQATSAPSASTQSAPAPSAPAYGQAWPSQAPQRPVDTPDGQYSPGPIFSENSPFRGGPPDGGEPAPLLDFGVRAQEAMTGRIMVGVGVNSDSGLVGSVVLDEQNFDWSRWPTSWEDIRNGTAWRGAGQRFRIEAAPGIATATTTSPVSRYMITFQDPFVFNTQVSLGLSGYYYNRIFNEYTDTRVGGRIALGYQFTPDLSGTIAYRGAKVNITNPIDPYLPALAEVINRDLALHGFQASLTLDKRDNAFLATEGYLIEGSFEEVLGSYQYPHAEIDLRKYFTLHERPDGSGRQVLSLAARAGFTGDNTPIYERYYAGGYSSLRGFAYRGVSPTEIGPSTGNMIAVGGDFMMLASAEYLFPITADDMIRGVVFCDTGTVEPTASHWNNKYRVAPGFGLRIIVPAMGQAPIALDFAFPVCKNDGDTQEVFSFFVGFGR